MPHRPPLHRTAIAGLLGLAVLAPVAAPAAPLFVTGGLVVPNTQVYEGGSNFGSVQVTGTGTFVNAPGGGAMTSFSQFVNGGSFVNSNDFNNLGTLNNSGTLTNFDLLANFGTATNFGLLDNFGAASNQNVFSNFGVLRQRPGASFVNRAASVVTNAGSGGLTVSAGAQVTNQFGGGLVNQGQATIEGAASLTNQGTTTNDVTGRVSNRGTLSNAANATLINRGTIGNTSAALLDNRGTLRNEKGALIEFAGPYKLGGTVVNNGRIVNTGGKLELSGLQSGSGVYSAGLISLSGFFTVGNSIGLATLDGDVEILDGSMVTMEVGGADRGDMGDGDGIGYDALDITGALSIQDGVHLRVRYVDGYTPTVGDAFDVFYGAGAMTGGFTSSTPGWEIGSMTGDFGAFGTALRMQFVGVPEPAALTLLLAGLLGLGYARRSMT